MEQYATNPSLTASVVQTALEREDIGPGRTVLDLGCGTGQLTLGWYVRFFFYFKKNLLILQDSFLSYPFGSVFFLPLASMVLFSALVDSDFVWGIDYDPTAMQVATENIRALEMEDRVSVVLAHVGPPPTTSAVTPLLRRKNEKQKGKNINNYNRNHGKSGRPPPPPSPTANLVAENSDQNDCNDGNNIFPFVDQCVDTVMTNPPFGTKPDKAGMDAEFLKLACRLATRAVYSFHKTSTRSYIVSLAKSLPKVENVTVVAEMKFDIPQTYKFHKKASVDVLVDLIRVQLKNESSHLKSDH